MKLGYIHKVQIFVNFSSADLHENHANLLQMVFTCRFVQISMQLYQGVTALPSLLPRSTSSNTIDIPTSIWPIKTNNFCFA